RSASSRDRRDRIEVPRQVKQLFSPYQFEATSIGSATAESPRHRSLFGDRLTQDARQRFHRVGLLNQLETVMGVFRQHVAVAGGQDDGQARIAFADNSGELDTVHAGHDDVGEQEVDGELVLQQDRQRSARLGDAPYGVAEIFQKLGGEGAD